MWTKQTYVTYNNLYEYWGFDEGVEFNEDLYVEYSHYS